jgi:hypothetical protein
MTPESSFVTAGTYIHVCTNCVNMFKSFKYTNDYPARLSPVRLSLCEAMTGISLQHN